MNEIQKSTVQTVVSRSPDAETMKKISSFARRTLLPEEVYAFPVVLCDNDIDRDAERFTEDCIKELASLMVGRPGIRDHEAKAENLTARLYDCAAETSTTEKNTLGMPLVRLIGQAYMLRTEANRETIAAIEGGIAKEVSISCAVKEQRCSVCGRDARICAHIKGRMYGDKRCYAELNRPTDAYEWSFVAIPAQKGAGVMKTGKAVNSMKENEAIVKSMATGTLASCDKAVTLSSEEAMGLSERVAELQKLAAIGKQHEENEKSELMRLCRLCDVAIEEDVAKSIGEKLTASERQAVKSWLEDVCRAKVPVSPQLAVSPQPTEHPSLDYYRI